MAPALPPSQAPLQGRTVLIVEDSAVQRDHATSLVTRLGAASPMVACDGLEGLACLARSPEIDLVLTDLEMPHMDGVRFIGEFAARGFRPELIVMSSLDVAVLHSVRLMAETYGLVVPGILSKPWSEEALRKLFVGSVSPAFPLPPSHSAIRDAPSLAEIAGGIQQGAFICYFQPQVTFSGGVLKGVEALVRWRHPSYGLLGPAAFLPQAETQEDLMSALTQAILTDVAGHWHRWHQKGLNVGVSINLSAINIGTPGFSDQLMEICEKLGLPSKAIIFEVTESASISNLGRSLENLTRLRMRGFRLSIDDFGTGFATFEQLERIPFTELKIDQSLTRHLPQTERNLVLVRGLLQMARGMGLATVAEGVETYEAWAALRDMDCELAQGYLIARPMPGDQLLDWVQQDRSHLRRGTAASG